MDQQFHFVEINGCPGMDAQDEGQFFLERPGTLLDLGDLFQSGADDLFQDLVEQLFLIVEVIIKGGVIDSGGPGDIPGGGVFKAFLGKKAGGRFRIFLLFSSLAMGGTPSPVGLI